MPVPLSSLLARVPANQYHEELAYLKARLKATDSLIRSLEAYLRYTQEPASIICAQRPTPLLAVSSRRARRG